MKNRIRIFRQRHGLTLRQLADEVGTTPQTVSRLETGNMTLSTEWLERFAGALRVHPVDLLEGPGSRNIQMLGSVSEDGAVRAMRHDSLTIDVPAENPVSVKLERAYGSYRVGEIVIGDRLPAGQEARGAGRDCIVMTCDEQLRLTRLLPFRANGSAPGEQNTILVPLEPLSRADAAPDFNAPILWAAPVIMRVLYV